MTWVTLAIGSNAHPYENIRSALDALLLAFRDLKLSNIFESRAQGQGRQADYLNMAVAFETDMSLPELLDFLKRLERKHRRNAHDSAAGIVTLDLDILTYGNSRGRDAGIELPRAEILERAYVLRPLSQVAGKQRHPDTGKSYAEHWKSFAGERDTLHPVDFEWHGRRLSSSR